LSSESGSKSGESSPQHDRNVGSETSDAGQRKEKVLHTRIPDNLDRQIKKRARNLGMSVSTVVRNVLLHTFDLVEDIVTDGTNLALSIAGKDSARSDRNARGSRPATPSTEVLAWQEAVLNVNAVCDQCNAILQKGTTAAVGLRDTPGPRAIICTSCLANLAKEEEPS